MTSPDFMRWELSMLMHRCEVVGRLLDALSHDDVPPEVVEGLREADAAFDAFPPVAWWKSTNDC